MKKNISILLIFVLLCNLLTFTAYAENQYYTITDNSVMIDFTQQDVGSDISSLGILEGSIADDNGTKVYKWSGSTGAGNKDIKISIPNDFEFSDGAITIETTLKMPATNDFRIIPVGINSDSNNEIIQYDTGILGRSSAVVESCWWKPLVPAVTRADASSKYHTYRIVIQPEVGTFSDIVNNSQQTNSRRYDIYVKAEDSDTWSVYENDLMYSGVRIDDVTGIVFRSETGSTATSQSINYYVKDVKVSQQLLTLKSTNISEGINPVFSEKNIRLSFSLPVSADTLNDGIELYKDGQKVTSGVSINPDQNDSKVVYVQMEEFPQYGSNYELRINDKLNKNKDGFTRTPTDYSKTIAFHNEQRSDLAVESTVPQNGELYAQKTITLDFNGSINLDSAKTNIKVYKGETQLELDADYSLSLKENDETALYIELSQVLEYDVTYKVTVDTQLNKDCMGYAIFPQGSQEYALTFYNAQNTGLAIENTIPQNGALYSEKQLTINFNSPINLDSAKTNIKVYKGETQLELDADYSLSLNESDETVVCIALNQVPEYDVTYKVTVGTSLNDGCMGYSIFPVNTEDYNFTFYNERPVVKTEIGFDFTQMDESSDISSIVGNASEVSIGSDGGVNVLKWSGKAETETKKLNISLTNNFDFENGPIVFEATLKMPTTHGFRIIPIGINSDTNNEIINYYTGIYGRDSDVVQAYNWQQLAPAVTRADASSKYYTYKIVIHPEVGTFSEPKDNSVHENSRRYDIYVKAEDDSIWSVYKDTLMTSDIRIDDVTGVSFWVEKGTDEILDYYVKDIKVTQQQLKLESTNIPSGDNPIFGEKNIQLNFNMPVSEDTLSAGIGLYKDGQKVEGINLSVDENDNKIVYVQMTEFPQYGANYELRLNDKLNKDKSGYAKTAAEYSKTIAFHNEQRTDLAIVSTTPQNGSVHSEKKLTIDLNSSVNLDSAKIYVKVYKGEQQLVLGTDYTLSLNENDESIMYINLSELPKYDVTYKVTIGASLNIECMGYAVFPADAEDYNFTFYNEKAVGKTDINIDFTQMDESSDISSILSDSTNTTITADGEENVLIWSTQNGESSDNPKKFLVFPEEFDATKGPVTIEFTARVPSSFMSATILGRNSTGETVAVSPYAGFENWDWDDLLRNSEIEGSDSKYFIDGSTLALSAISSKYYTYKFVIDYPADSIGIYVKEAGMKNWSEQFKTVDMNLSANASIITGLEFAKRLGKPSEKGGSPNEMITWYIKDIKVSQVVTPAVTSSDVVDKTTDVSDELNEINIEFNSTIVPSSINKENVSLVLVERGEEKDVTELYDVSVNNDSNGVKILFNDDLGMNKVYRLKIKNVIADTNVQGVMSAEKVIEFTTAKKYEILTPTVITDDTTIGLSGAVRTYYKASNDDYIVMATLVSNEGEISCVKYSKEAVPQLLGGFNEPGYTISFDKPDGFVAENYNIKIYVFNGMQNSVSNCKMLEIPIVSE